MPTDNGKNMFDKLYARSVSGEFESINTIRKPEELTIKSTTTLIDDELLKSFGIALGVDFSKNKVTVPMPKKYIINKGATVLIWDNGEKTIVKRCEDDEFNKRLGFLTAFFQHYCGMSKNKANKFLAELEVEDEEAKTTKAKHMKGE